MASLAAKLSAANNSDAQAKDASAAFSTVNATTEKAFAIRSAIQNVKPAALKETIALLTENSLQDVAPSTFLLGNSVSVGAVGTAGLPFNPFFSVRYAITQAFAAVVNVDTKSVPNYESRVALLVAVVEFAAKQPNAASLLSESFAAILPKPKGGGFELTADGIFTTLNALGLSPALQWSIAIGLSFSSADSTKAEGRRLLDKLAVTQKSSSGGGGNDGDSLTVAALEEMGLSAVLISNLYTLINSMENLPAVFNSLRNGFGACISSPSAHAPSLKDCVNSLSNSFSLAGLVEELGPNCVATHQDCLDVLDMVPHLSARHVAECLALFASPSIFNIKDSNTYNSLRVGLQLDDAKPPATLPPNASPTFVVAVKERMPKLNWTEVLQCLDNPQIRLERFASIAAAHKKAMPDHNLPCEAFLGKWKNVRIQSQAIKFMIECPDLVDFAVSREVQITQGRGHLHQHVNSTLRTLPESITGTATVCPGFGCIDFVESVVYCMSRDKELEKVVANAMRDAPALLFAGLISSRPQGTLQHLTMAAQVLKQAGPTATLTDAVAQHVTKEGLTSAVIALFGDLVTNEPARFVEAIESLAHSQFVPAVLTTNTNLKLVVGCAIAGRETHQTPDFWVRERLGEKRESVPSTTADGSNRFAVAAALLEVSEEFMNKQKFVGSTTNALKDLFTSSVASMLPAISAHAKVLLDSGDSAFPAEVEAEANTLFRTFIEPSNANKISPIAECEKLYKSDNPRDKQLFACVVHILFEECKAIGSYPWSSLTAAARLFGQLVDRNLLTNQRVQMALQFIHTAISKNDQRATEFGIMALECFYKRLEEWPHYGKQLRAIDNVYLDMRIPGVMAVVNRSLKQQRRKAEEAAAAGGLPADPAIKAGGPAKEEQTAVKDIGLHQHDITVLISSEDKFSVPSQIIQNQINFLVGNTDPSKLHSNAQDLKRLVLPEFYPYFADYFVVKRIALELNHHAMYLDLLAAIGSLELDKAIRLATVKAVDRILRSEKVRTDPSERTLLKSLGAWYGQITIARNIPVFARELDFKQMLRDGLKEGKLIAVVPFIAKVLEHVVTPKCIFRPPNPWTMCQLETLLEVYTLRDLRITLRFEVEVLLKNINVKPEEIANFTRTYRGIVPRSYVSLAEIRETMDVTGSTDFRCDENNTMYSQGGISVRHSPPPPKTTRLTADAAPYQPQRTVEPPPIPAYPVVALSEATVVVTDDARYFPAEKLGAYRNAIVKILDPVVNYCSSSVDRIVNIATYTTISLVLKDFPVDSDPNAVLRACIAVSRSLAANLCINLRDTLHSKIMQFVEYLASQVVKDQKKEEFEMLKETIYRNNFGVVLRTLESQAAERVVVKVRDILTAFQRSPETYNRFRLTPEEQITMSPAPDVLRARPPGPEQRGVYEEFFSLIPSLELLNATIKNIEETATRFFEKQQGSPDQFPPIFSANFFSDAPISSFHSDIRDRLTQIKANCVADNALLMMRTAMTKLMTFAARMQTGDLPRGQVVTRDAILFTLTCARNAGTQELIINELTEMYLAETDRWRSHLLTVELLRHKLLDVEALDARIASELNGTGANKSRMTDFVRQLLDAAILSNPRVLQVTDIPKTVDALKSRAAAAAQTNAPSSDYSPKVKAIRLYSYYASDVVRGPMRATISEYLDEWVKIVGDRHRPENSDSRSTDADYRKRSMDFMERLQRRNMLKSLDGGHLDCLIGTMLELGVEHYAAVSLRQERAGLNGKDRPSEIELYTKIDAFNDLLQVLLRCCNTPSNGGDVPNPNPPEVNLITKILSVVNKVLVFNHDHTLNRTEPGKDHALHQQQLIADGNRPPLPEDEAYQVNFMQRPYVRFISNILVSNLRSSADPSPQQQIIVDETVRVVLENLMALNPHVRPAFAFGWLELVCHRLLLPRAIRTPIITPNTPASIAQNPRRHWGRYANLLVAGLRFLDPFTKNPEGIQRPVITFFRSFLKLMLVILHDFPEYILYTSYMLCDCIPSCCIQLRNVVLCAFPNSVRLPDPFKYKPTMPNSDNESPPECPDYIIDGLKDVTTSEEVQRLIISVSGSWASVREDTGRIVERLCDRGPHGGRKWNIPAINSLVVTLAVKQLSMTNQEPRMGADNPTFRIVYAMSEMMDNEGRYYLINAFANQLRFPNSHTRFFSSLLLGFFLMAPEDGNQRTMDLIQEQILRAIVERLVATRPHPWGLLVTFVELFTEARYDVWSKPCVRCSPEVDRTVQQLAKTIGELPRPSA